MNEIVSSSVIQVNSDRMRTFAFYGDEITMVSTPDGEWWAVLARLCDPLDLDTQAQWRKLEKLDWARVAKIATPDERGQEQEFCCLNLRSVAGWLFTVNVGKVAEHLRAKLKRYQRECADALNDYALGKRGATAPADMSAVRTALREEMSQELAAIRAEMAALRVPMMQGPAIGNGAAAMYILAPLREVARIQAKALKSETPATIKRLRFNAERALRDAVHFPMFAGQTWAAFPHARLGDAQCAILRMLGEARRLADVATPKATQLALTGPAKAAVSLAVDNTRKAVTP